MHRHCPRVYENAILQYATAGSDAGNHAALHGAMIMPHRHVRGLLLSSGHGFMHGEHLRMIMTRCRISRVCERRTPEGNARKKPDKQSVMPPPVSGLWYEFYCHHGCFTGFFLCLQDMALSRCGSSGNFPDRHDRSRKSHYSAAIAGVSYAVTRGAS